MAAGPFLPFPRILRSRFGEGEESRGSLAPSLFRLASFHARLSLDPPPSKQAKPRSIVREILLLG